MGKLSRKVVEEVTAEWKAGEFWSVQRWGMKEGKGYCPSPDEERSQLRGCLSELSERAARSATSLLRIRLSGENPYTLVPGGTVVDFIETHLDTLRWLRSACYALRQILKKLPPPTPPKPSQKNLFN